MNRIAYLICMVLALMLATPVALAETSPDSTADTMQSSEAMSKYKEDLPASRFVLIAYGVVWAGLFVFLMSIRKRQSSLDERIEHLEAALKRHDGSSEAA